MWKRREKQGLNLPGVQENPNDSAWWAEQKMWHSLTSGRESYTKGNSSNSPPCPCLVISWQGIRNRWSLLLWCSLPFPSHGRCLYFHFCPAPTYPPPYAVQIPRKTTLTDPAHCPCPCLDGDFRPGCHRSRWLHLDGLRQRDRFLPLTSSAVAKHVAGCVVPSWSLLCKKSLQTTTSRCCGHRGGPVYGSEFFPA